MSTIRRRTDGYVLYVLYAGEYTTLRDAVEDAVRKDALTLANLTGATLTRAYRRTEDAPVAGWTLVEERLVREVRS